MIFHGYFYKRARRFSVRPWRFHETLIFFHETLVFFYERLIFFYERPLRFSLRPISNSHNRVEQQIILLTSYFWPHSSHFVCDSHFVWSIYMVVLTQKHPTHVAHVAPMLRVGLATWVGCFPFSLTYARTRDNLTAHPWDFNAIEPSTNPALCR